MNKLLRELVYAEVSFFCGIAVGMVIVFAAPQRLNDPVGYAPLERGIDLEDYLAGMRERGAVIEEAVSRNATLAQFIQQDPMILYDPIAYVVWRQNTIIIGVEYDYWRGQSAPAGYEQFHLSATHTARTCRDLMQLTQDAIWPPE